MKYIFLILLPLLSLLACETTVDIPLPEHERRIVINGILQADQEIEVYISRSYAPTEEVDAETVILKDAQVELLANDQVIATMVYRDTVIENWEGNTLSLGKFVAEGIMGEAGKSYGIRVTHPDFPTASAVATTPPQTPIIRTEVVQDVARKVYEDGFTEVQSFFRLTIKDTAAFENYYRLENLNIFVIDPFTQQDTFELEVWDPQGEATLGTDGAYETQSRFFSDASFNGQEKTIDLLLILPTFFTGGEQVTELDIVGITCELSTSFQIYKNYEEKLELQRTSGEGIDFLPSEPVVIDSNVENGYGLFSGSSRTKFSQWF